MYLLPYRKWQQEAPVLFRWNIIRHNVDRGSLPPNQLKKLWNNNQSSQGGKMIYQETETQVVDTLTECKSKEQEKQVCQETFKNVEK